MGSLSKEVVKSTVNTLPLRTGRPAVRSKKFFCLDWLHLAQTHGLLTKFLEKPAKFYLPWTNSFSIQLAKAPYNPWEKGIKAAPTKAKE